MGIARSTYYREPKGSADDTALVEAMHAIKDEFEAYGWRRMQAQAQAPRIVSASAALPRPIAGPAAPPSYRRARCARRPRNGPRDRISSPSATLPVRRRLPPSGRPGPGPVPGRPVPAAAL